MIDSAEDIVRIVAISSVAATIGVAIMNIRLAFKIIKPWKVSRESFISGDGLFWAHILFIVVPMHTLLVWAAVEVIKKLGTVPPPYFWKTPMLVVCSLLILAGNVTIYRIKCFRLIVKEREIDDQ